MRKQLLLLAIVAILAFAGVALAQDSHLASGSLVESESSVDVAARAETFAEAEADLDAQMDAASDAENEVESDAESDEAAEADADSETDALTEENNTALLEVNDKSEAARHHHRHHWHWRPWWHHHRAAHQSHRKAHFHVDPHKGKRCVRWGHGRGYWKSFHGRTHKRSWLRRHFWGRHHHHRHHHHGRHHHHRHHHGHHRHHRHHWGHWFHRHHGHRHHGHHHHRHHGHHHHRHHHHGGHHHHRHHGGGGGGHRHHHHHHHRGGGRRRFFLEMETEVQPAAASLVESAAERHHHHHHGHHHGHHHHGHHHHGHQQGAGRFWVPGPWKCIEWGEVPHPVDAPAPPAPVKRPWCEENVWMASSTHGYKVYYAAKCNKAPPADVVPAPKEPAKRASWCEEHADMKKGDNAGYYYHKCGGAPTPPKPKPLPPSVPKAPVEDREKWCKDFGYLRWTGNRPYYCSKCSSHCTAEKPATPPRPHGVPKAPKSKVERQNWCEQYNWMRWGRHSTYYYVKCGGAPPKAAPKAPEHVDHPPPKSERKPWCQEHNYFRYSKHYSAYFYEKCGGLVPATPQKKPKCPRWLPKIQEEHRAEFCHDYEWIKTNRKYKSCYCSKCSCPADALPAQRPANIPRPPPKRAERKAWCHEFHYLRFGSAQTYYCSRCGCKRPAKAKAPKDAPKVEGDLHKWCVANQRYRYYEASKGVSASSQWFYKLCGAAPLPLSSPPANIPKPPPRGQRTDWCAQYKSLEQTDSKNWYCHKCSCALPPPPPKFQPKLSPSFCDDNRYMTQTSKAAYYYSKCGGAPAKKPAVVKAAKTVNVAAPEPGTNQVHVHVNVAAPKTKKSNAGLKAMVSRVAKKNEEAAGKMDAILKKLKSQDCRDGNCLPKTHKEMAKWKADWILETEETGKTVP